MTNPEVAVLVSMLVGATLPLSLLALLCEFNVIRIKRPPKPTPPDPYLEAGVKMAEVHDLFQNAKFQMRQAAGQDW